MKTYSLFSTLAILILIFILWDSKTTDSENLENERKEKEFHKAEAKASQTREKLWADTIETQRLVIANVNTEKESQKEVARYWQKRSKKMEARLAANQPRIDSLASQDTSVMVLHLAYVTCDSTQRNQAKTIDLQEAELNESGKLIKLQDNALAQKDTTIHALDSALKHSEAETKLTAKRERKKGFKRGLVIGLSLGILGLLL